jgi:3-oxosteroid 1-dehydrogenase
MALNQESAAARSADDRVGSRLPVQQVSPGDALDATADVVVVGSGAAGWTAAVIAATRGASVLVLEKAEAIGGSTRKSGAWVWVPNNRFLREAGIEDKRDEAVGYMARLSRPEMYDPESPTFGMPQEDFELLGGFYDSVSVAVEALESAGALEVVHISDLPDYYAQLPENRTPEGRVLMPRRADGEAGDGEDLVLQLSSRAQELGVEARCGHRVTGALVDDAEHVVGVTASTADGPVRVRARQAVIFASGGFGQNPDMRRAYLAGPIFGSCSVHTNTGDFIPIASALGAPLYNMNYPWLGPVLLERGLRNRPDHWLMFYVAGDSVLLVNRHGHRFVDEKFQYNELALPMWNWDATRAEYPNLFPIMVWDHACQEHWQADVVGSAIVPPGEDDGHIVRGETLAELTTAIRKRLHELRASTGGHTLDEAFETTLQTTIERFNLHAARGEDPDFHRGSSPISHYYHGAIGTPRPGTESNPLLHPLSETGPYYAAILAPGTHDTKGGPRTDKDARILDAAGAPIPGLYGAGNCVASVSGKAYFAGGATIGAAMAFGYRAALSAVQEPVRGAVG